MMRDEGVICWIWRRRREERRRHCEDLGGGWARGKVCDLDVVVFVDAVAVGVVVEEDVELDEPLEIDQSQWSPYTY